MQAFDVIVVGAGVAGLCTALAAAPRRVLLVCRGRPGSDGSSAWAQGGIAAAVGDGDDWKQHYDDTLRAGAGHNLRAAVERLTQSAPDTIGWLQQLGLAFDRDGERPALGREGGHLRHRILHSGGDATGACLMRTLAAALSRSSHVTVIDGCDLEGLLLCGSQVCGVSVRDAGGRSVEYGAAAVVLATGGIGGLYRYTTNPGCVDGAGLALAIAAGAATADLEFVQFHPTALAPNGSEGGQRLPLVTEALRGAGAVLVDGGGRRLMAGLHPMQDLAPRDVVSRAVWHAQADGIAVYLDARMLGNAFRRRFPTVHALCAAQGIDPLRQPIPIIPAQHFHMGGVRVDLESRSSLDGLFAVGEVACNGVHGANRLASNSLLEGAVFGRALGARLAAALPSPARGSTRGVRLRPAADDAARLRLRALLWRGLGLLRDAPGIRSVIDTIAADHALGECWQGQLATHLATSALARPESLGSHHRSDAPHLARA